MPTQKQELTEDEIFDKAVAGMKAIGNGIKDYIDALKNTTSKFWAKFEAYLFVVSGIEIVVSLVFLLFKAKNLAHDFAFGGLISIIFAVPVLMLNVKKGKNCTSKYKFENEETGEVFEENGEGFDFSEEGEQEDLFQFTEEEPIQEDEEEEDFFGGADFGVLEEPVAKVSVEEAMENIVVPEGGLYVRQYLFDMFTKVLENITPGYSTVKEIRPESDVFLAWEKYLRDSCEQTGVKEENLPTLERLEETLFTIKLTFNRPKVGFKGEAVADELVSIYSYLGGKYNSKVYATIVNIAKECIITVFTGETAMISLKDMYDNCEKFVLDRKNYMPIVLGIDAIGDVITCDFKKIESLLIAGMPRAGKSWFAQAVLTQMCAFVPPSELNIYICDPKDGISDFKAFKLPHVKKFVSGDDNIVNTLRSVVKDLAPKRKKIIGDAGFVNIWDFKEVNPDVKMPVIYILIDEVVTLAERMEKETKQEFQGLLVELISQLPALGIRAFLIPHVIKDQIIAKTASDLIQCRISIMGDAGHIEACTATKPKDFSYKLVNKGDMAARIPLLGANTLYIHSPALSDSNPKNNKLFEYLLKMWSKLEPDEVKDSVVRDYFDEKQDKDSLVDLKKNIEETGNIGGTEFDFDF
jgi:S-DNA-T family DNA segregation ATPase FtsK/SpoIIIE